MTVGSDHSIMPSMLNQIKRRYGRRPRRYLVDGGFNKNDDTEWAAGIGVKVYGPPIRSKHDTDPYAPRRDDGPGVAAWRRRMKSPHGKTVYKRRSMGECINARLRQWNLRQFVVPASQDDGGEVSPVPENRRADAHMGGAELNGGRKIGAHAHRQFLQAVARRDLRGQREMRRRRIVDRRNAHQPGNFQAIFVAAGRDEGVRLIRRHARLLRLLAGVELHEQFRRPFLRN